jgi:hypothetical protein
MPSLLRLDYAALRRDRHLFLLNKRRQNLGSSTILRLVGPFGHRALARHGESKAVRLIERQLTVGQQIAGPLPEYGTFDIDCTPQPNTE